MTFYYMAITILKMVSIKVFIARFPQECPFTSREVQRGRKILNPESEKP